MNDKCNYKKEIPRIVPIEGATNFRELGGYSTKDGRRIKSGLFYRSGTLYDLNSNSDKAALNELGLKLVLDLRSTGECRECPDYIPDGTDYLQICAMRYEDGEELDFSPSGIERVEHELAISNQELSPLDTFAEFYARMPFGNPAYQALFQALEAERVPLLFHCTSGKDRTGVAAMLILLALGANRETVIADYMETNRCRTDEIEALSRQYGNLAETDTEQWEQLFVQYGVLPRFADAVLDAILQRYGSWEAYFDEEFGLDKKRLAFLRDRYLE